MEHLSFFSTLTTGFRSNLSESNKPHELPCINIIRNTNFRINIFSDRYTGQFSQSAAVLWGASAAQQWAVAGVSTSVQPEQGVASVQSVLLPSTEVFIHEVSLCFCSVHPFHVSCLCCLCLCNSSLCLSPASYLCYCSCPCLGGYGLCDRSWAKAQNVA